MADIGTPSGALDDVSILRKVVYSAKQKVKSVLPSVVVAIKSEYESMPGGDIMITKPGILLDVSNEGKAGQGQSVRLTMRDLLKKRASYGTESEKGDEDETGLLACELFYNEINKAVKMWNRGFKFNDTAHLKFQAGYNPLVSLFLQELDDLFIHQSLLTSYAENLTFAPVSKAPMWNKNVFIPTLASSEQPSYDATALTKVDGAADSYGYFSARTYAGNGANGTFTDQIWDKLAAVYGSGASPTPGGEAGIKFWISVLEHLEVNNILDVVTIDGRPTIVVLVPPQINNWMINPMNEGSFAAWYKDVADYKSDDRDILPGEYARILDIFLLCKDLRGVTVTRAGSTDTGTLKPGYVLPGGPETDTRNKAAWSATNFVYDAMFFLGADALAKYTRDELETGIVDTEDYGRVKGVNAYKGEGYQLPFFDKSENATAASRVYKGSMVALIARYPVAA